MSKVDHSRPDFEYEVLRTCQYPVPNVGGPEQEMDCGDPAAYYGWWGSLLAGWYLCREHLDFILEAEAPRQVPTPTELKDAGWEVYDLRHEFEGDKIKLIVHIGDGAETFIGIGSNIGQAEHDLEGKLAKRRQGNLTNRQRSAILSLTE